MMLAKITTRPRAISRIVAPMASLCRLNRRQASCLVVRTLSSTAAVTAPAVPAPGSRTATGPPAEPPASSRITDPRVQEGVRDVGHQVEQDHERNCDHDPGKYLRVVAVRERGDEKLAHPGPLEDLLGDDQASGERPHVDGQDRKSTRLNSSHVEISYAVFCLKKKK